MTTDQMIEVIDSYHSTRTDGNVNLLKCSLIAAYAVELGYAANGYDFRRNTVVRDYIDRLMQGDEVLPKDVPVVYKSLDIAGFINCNGDKLVQALSELDSNWKQISISAAQNAKQNKMLMKINADSKAALIELTGVHDELASNNAELSRQNKRLVTENRYLRKMLRTYLYPAIAEEILVRENALKKTCEKATDAAIMDMTELGTPKSFQESVASDVTIQSEEEQLLQRMWGMIDGET
jgi:hypothetical protein